jgi:hypothetical protein
VSKNDIYITHEELQIRKIICDRLDSSDYISEAYLMRKCKISFDEAKRYIEMFTYLT